MSTLNRYYPAYLDLKDKLCIVVGGGMIALRKVDSLASSGARVRVVAPEIIQEIRNIDSVELVIKPYEQADIAEAFLVIAATDDEETNLKVSRDACERHIFCNVVDRPDQCSFIVPSVIERGPIKIAISTGGVSPALSKRLRMDIGGFIGEEYEILAYILGKIRPLVLAQNGGHTMHKRVFEVLVNSQLLEAIRQGNKALVEDILAQAIGMQVDLEGLL